MKFIKIHDMMCIKTKTRLVAVRASAKDQESFLNARFKKTPLFAFRSYKKTICRMLLNEVKNRIQMDILGDTEEKSSIAIILLS